MRKNKRRRAEDRFPFPSRINIQEYEHLCGHGRSQDFFRGGGHFSKIFKIFFKKIAKNALFKHVKF